jgi:serine/threonine protein kinase/tetratricopeptide (TPR) repeat protein
MSFSTGDRFDRYVIEELLGEGGMAQVYRAHDPRLHRRVALKILRGPEGGAEAVLGPGDLALREARAAASLDHPNAVAVFDVGKAEGQLFIAMELVNGKSLRAFVSDTSISWDIKLRWMVDAARALGAAHERGLVHRDVKPENIMVRNDGVVKVLDFGIAKRTIVDLGVAGTADEAFTQSISGGILGTPWYLSPEQLRGEVVDGRADQFSWAVTTYELLTGQLPWPKGVDGFQLVLAILNATPPAPSTLLRDLPAIADAALMKALAKTPSQRFDAMDSVVAALEGLCSPSRRSWADVQTVATTKTDPAPAMTPSLPIVLAPAGTQITDGAATLSNPGPPARSSLVRPLAIVTLAAAAVAVVGLTYGRLGRSQTDATAKTAPVTSVTTVPAPTAITALPPPSSRVPEALTAYATFRQSFRDADWSSAMRALETAVERDPDMAAAHLRLAFLRSLEATKEGLVRSSFHAATRNRGSLDARDMGLLDALEPYLQRDPSDPLEAERRLEALRQRWPQDAELAYILGSVRYDRGDLTAAVEAFDAATTIDPGFAQAQSSRGGCLAYLGRLDDAHAALEAALRQSPTATEALWYEAEIAEQRGRCVEEEAVAREWLARDPDDAFAYNWLASALAGEGRPVDTVRTAVEQKWPRMEASERAEREPVDRANLDLMTGDFASAEAHLGALEALLASEPGAQTHAESQAMLVRIAEETGRTDRARDIAASYLARRDAWSPPHRVDDVSILLDPAPTMLGALARAGAITASQRAAQRAQWLTAWRGKTSATYLGHLWVSAWALPAGSRDDGVAALEALPEMGGPPTFAPTIATQACVGRAYLLAGHVDEAIAPLRAGAATCTVLNENLTNTRGWHDLGVALEASDRDGACKAYGVVLARWGHAKPRSVTADDARARSKALGCP